MSSPVHQELHTHLHGEHSSVPEFQLLLSAFVADGPFFKHHYKELDQKQNGKNQDTQSNSICH